MRSDPFWPMVLLAVASFVAIATVAAVVLYGVLRVLEP